MISDRQGGVLPAEVTPIPGGARVRFVASLPGLGYDTFQVKPGGGGAAEETLSGPFTFENAFYKAVIQPDGAFTSLQIKPSGEELLQGGANPGNQLAARDSTGLGPQHEGTFDVTKWNKWEPSGRGPELLWQPSGPARVRRSPLGAIFTVSGAMGPSASGDLVVSFYQALRRIDLDWAFSFNDASIGHFFDDETKLRVQWPLSFQGDIHHDISFGVVHSRDLRPFLPASWVDISDGKKGLAYFHQGTIKHWVKDNTLVNLFAWGEHTDAIGNRLDPVRWPKCFDQRLRGAHTLHAAIYPHTGDWNDAGLVAAARSFGTPPLAFATGSHPGELPDHLNLLQFTDPRIATTSVRVQDGKIVCRLYSLRKRPVAVPVKSKSLQPLGLKSLTGESIGEIRPFQIAHLELK